MGVNTRQRDCVRGITQTTTENGDSRITDTTERYRNIRSTNSRERTHMTMNSTEVEREHHSSGFGDWREHGPKQQWYAILGDTAAILLAYYFAVSYYQGGRILSESDSLAPFLTAAACAVLFHVGANALAAGYRIIPRYIGLAEALRLFAAAVAAGVVLVVPVLLVPALGSGLPVGSIPIGALGAFAVMGGWRFAERILTERRQRTQQRAKDRVLLVGAGRGADMLVREIRRMRGLDVEVVGLVDDNPRLTGLHVHGSPVLGTSDDISTLVASYGVSQIIIAIPSATPKQLADIYVKCRGAGVPVKMAPSITDLIRDSGSPPSFRDLEITDLLDRPKIQIDPFAIAHHIACKRILVTGAAAR